jgi:hypothetical protein
LSTYSSTRLTNRVLQSTTAQDCLLVFSIFILSSANYIFYVGFYSDDWAVLATMHLLPDQSGIIRMFNALTDTHDHEIRPIQFLAIAVLYKIFGLDPVGYHLINSTVLLLGFILLYLTARALHQPRVLALSVALLFMLVPNYSTDRFWIASSAANISMCFFLLALYVHLQALRRCRDGFWRWEPFAVLGVLGSGFSYEVFLPLFLVASTLLFVWELATKRSRPAGKSEIGRAVLHQAPIVSAVVLIVFIKALWAPRVPHDFEILGYLIGVGRSTLKAAVINYGYHLLLLPCTVWHATRYYADPMMIIAAGVIGFSIWIRLYTLFDPLIGAAVTSRAKMSLYVGCGIALFVAGYSLFPINPTENGPNNRAAIAGTLGFAVSIVGLLGLLTSTVAAVWRKMLFSTIIAAIGMGGALILDVIASFWITSYRLQIEILTDIRRQIPEMPSGTTLILDGICSYHGVAPVFEATWDLAGALSILYKTSGIEANIAGRGVSIGQNGLIIPPSGDSAIYPYGNLYVYHFGRKEAYALPSAQVAKNYFDSISSERGSECPADVGGNGTDVLNSLVARLRRAAAAGIVPAL